MLSKLNCKMDFQGDAAQYSMVNVTTVNKEQTYTTESAWFAQSLQLEIQT